MRIFSLLVLFLVCGICSIGSAVERIVPNAEIPIASLPCVSPDLLLPAGELMTESCRKVEPQQNHIAVKRSGEGNAASASAEIIDLTLMLPVCRIVGGMLLPESAVCGSSDSFSPLIPRAGPVRLS